MFLETSVESQATYGVVSLMGI